MEGLAMTSLFKRIKARMVNPKLQENFAKSVSKNVSINEDTKRRYAVVDIEFKNRK